MKRPIENKSSPGRAIYDPFVGSGTTIIAAEMTARACHALEINPAYCDVTIERWQNFTGGKAEKVSNAGTYTNADAVEGAARPSESPRNQSV
jgi:DNA modification methylase